jgi:hypothetical protein
MASQNINQYVYKKIGLKFALETNDMSLASDEKDFNQEVVFSPYLIAQTIGNRMPFSFDINNPTSTYVQNLTYGNYNFDNILVSENYYNPNNYTESFLYTCPSATTICDIGLTGIDNGLVTGMTGFTITATTGLFTGADVFNRYTFDSRLKLHQVTGFTDSPNGRFSGFTKRVLYEIVTKTAPTIGTYEELYGGFYQGFYKLFGYDYEVFPQRMNKGWAVEMILKPRFSGNNEYTPSTGQTTLNLVYPNNKNTFFYMGSRAENKFYHHASGSPSSDTGYTRTDLSCYRTCGCYFSATSVTSASSATTCIEVYQPFETTVVHNIGCNCGCNDSVITDIPELDPKYDAMSNAISFRLCGDPENPSIGVRAIYFTGGCETTGSCYTTGVTYTTGYTIFDECSPTRIYDYCFSANSAYTLTEHWFLFDAVWERYTWLDTCDLWYRGGLGEISKFVYLDSLANNSVYLIEPPVTSAVDPVTPEQIEIVRLNERWLINKHYRNGRLKFYINGRLFWVIEKFEEVIPRALDTRKERQVGVPFNISWGGGTQGLRENLTFSGCSGATGPYVQDPECFPNNDLSGTSLSALTTNILLEQNFAGSFDGGISQFRMYVTPLSAPEVKHNFKLLKDDWVMFNPDCPDCFMYYCPTSDYTYTI